MKYINKIQSYFWRICDIFDAWLWNLGCEQSRRSCVLMYHDLTTEDVGPKDCCLHSVEEFSNSLKKYKEEGYEFVTIDKTIAQPPYDHKYVTITFDDVFDSVYTLAYPVLKRNNIPFTLFVAPGLLGQEKMMTEEHLDELVKDELCTVGAHTMTHPMLRKANDGYNEILQSKLWLEKKYGKSIEYFAYPYGKHSSVSVKVMRMTKTAGFKCAFGTIDAPITKFTSFFKFYLPRMVVR